MWGSYLCPPISLRKLRRLDQDAPSTLIELALADTVLRKFSKLHSRIRTGLRRFQLIWLIASTFRRLISIGTRTAFVRSERIKINPYRIWHQPCFKRWRSNLAE